MFVAAHMIAVPVADMKQMADPKETPSVAVVPIVAVRKDCWLALQLDSADMLAGSQCAKANSLALLVAKETCSGSCFPAMSEAAQPIAVARMGSMMPMPPWVEEEQKMRVLGPREARQTLVPPMGYSTSSQC